MNELPYQTYERVTGKKWTGGNSADIQSAYKQYGITAPAASPEANLALQKALLGKGTPTTSTPPTTGSSSSPTSTPVGQFLYSDPTAGTALTDAEASYAEYLKNRTAQSTDPSAIRSEILSQYQDQINAINQIYEQQLAEARLTGQGRIGQGTAITARRGLAGSGRGEAMASSILKTNADEQNTINAQRAAAIGEIYGRVNEAVTKELNARREAIDKGYTDYISFLKGKDERKSEYLNSTVAQLIAQGIDPSSMDQTQLSDIAKKLGVSTNDIIGTYISQVALDAKAKKDAQDKVALDLQSKPQQVGEGEQLWTYDPISKKYVLQGKNPKTFAPKAGTGSTSTAADQKFAATIDTVANMEGSVAGKKAVKDQLTSYINAGDYVSAYNQISNSIEQGLTGESKQRFSNAKTDYQVMSGLKDSIEKYAAMGGDTNILKGTADKIQRRLGVLATDPKYAEIATELIREFQTYRNTMTGAAFGAGESREYAAVNPTSGKTLDLNIATIDGALAQLENRVQSTINSRVPSAKYILDYAKGITPESSAPQNSEPSISDLLSQLSPEQLAELQNEGLIQ